jgi:hypothetical protein
MHDVHALNEEFAGSVGEQEVIFDKGIITLLTNSD